MSAIIGKKGSEQQIDSNVSHFVSKQKTVTQFWIA
jgi:hypothetical protein